MAVIVVKTVHVPVKKEHVHVSASVEKTAHVAANAARKKNNKCSNPALSS